MAATLAPAELKVSEYIPAKLRSLFHAFDIRSFRNHVQVGVTFKMVQHRPLILKIRLFNYTTLFKIIIKVTSFIRKCYN